MFFPDIFLSSAERELIKIHLVPFHKQIWPHNSYWYKFIICTIQSISYIHGNLAFTYFLSYCKIIRFLFKNFNQKLEKYVLSDEKNISESEFEKFRILHLKLVSAVNKMDICYNKLTGFSILSLIVAIIISVYLLQKEKIEKTDFKISLFVGILITITFTFYLLYSVADINTKVSFWRTYIFWYFKTQLYRGNTSEYYHKCITMDTQVLVKVLAWVYFITVTALILFEYPWIPVLMLSQLLTISCS